MPFDFKTKEIENNKQKKIENDLDEIFNTEKKGSKLDFSHLEHKKKIK